MSDRDRYDHARRRNDVSVFIFIFKNRFTFRSPLTLSLGKYWVTSDTMSWLIYFPRQEKKTIAKQETHFELPASFWKCHSGQTWKGAAGIESWTNPCLDLKLTSRLCNSCQEKNYFSLRKKRYRVDFHFYFRVQKVMISSWSVQGCDNSYWLIFISA